ncbi:MAG: PAS domain-containing sensor histidine kinase [Alphaproteobacteria bacterium]
MIGARMTVMSLGERVVADAAPRDGAAGSEAAVLCLLDDGLRSPAPEPGLDRLIGRPPAPFASLRERLAGRILTGRLPAPDVAHPPLSRFTVCARGQGFPRVALVLTRLPQGWLLECGDVTAEDAAPRIAGAIRSAAGAVERRRALVEGLRAALGLHRIETSMQADPAVLLSLGDEQGVLAALWIVPSAEAGGADARDVARWAETLHPVLTCALRDAERADRLAEEKRCATDLLDRLNEALVSVDSAGHIASLSEGAERMFGIGRADAVGQPAQMLLSDEAPADRRYAFQHLLQQGRGDVGLWSRTAEAVALRGDGSPFEVRIGLVDQELDGDCRRTLVFEDISGQRTAELALERNRSQIVAILDSLRDAVIGVDQDLAIVYANDAAGALFGLTPADLLGTTVWDRAQPLWDRLGPELFRCVRQREKQEAELRWEPEERWFDARILPTEVGAAIFLLDVTDRRRARELQRESDARYRAVSALTTDLVFCYGVDASGLMVREWSIGRAVEVLGYDLPERLDGPKGFIVLAHAEDRGAASAAAARLLAGESLSTELRIVGLGGELRWIEVNAEPEWHPTERRVVRMLCAIRDVTARKDVETALRESEERFALAVEGAAEGLWDWDLRRRTVYRSEHLRGILGVGPDEDIQRWGWWVDQIHPDDLDGYRAALRRHRHGAGGLFAWEYRVRHRDGTWRWLLDRAVSRRDSAGRVVRFVGSVSDITDRKNMEIELKAAHAAVEEKNLQIQVALDNISQGLTMFDARGRLVLYNRRYADLYRLGDALRVGATRRDLLEASIAAGNYSAEEAETIVERTLAAAAAPRMGHIIQRLVDGTAVEAAAVHLPNGGSVATFTDITAREQREAELRAARDAAEAANRAKSAFLANMSHELRTPLNAVIGFSDVMRSEMFGPLGNAHYRDYASDIRNSGEMLLELINDILDLSKIEAGKAQVADDVLDVAEVVAGVVGLCRELPDASSVALRWRVAARMPLFRGDGRYLRQILTNLVSNAVKFTPAGGRVTVCAGCDVDGGIVLTVGDTGIGIPEELHQRVFEPFYQVQSDLARQYQGTGLGLSLVKGLTELHGGKVDVRSRRHGGTVFGIRLPASRNVRH